MLFGDGIAYLGFGLAWGVAIAAVATIQLLFALWIDLGNDRRAALALLIAIALFFTSSKTKQKNNEIAKAKPETHRDLVKIAAVSRYHGDRYGRDLVAIVRKALEIPEAELPDKNDPKPWIRDKALENRINRLKTIRDRQFDPEVVQARHASSRPGPSSSAIRPPTCGSICRTRATSTTMPRACGAG